MNIGLITQARFSSNRLPGKVLKKINNQSLLEIHLLRLKKSQLVNTFIVATTKEVEATAIVDVAHKNGFKSYQGEMNDVLDRFYQAAKLFKLDLVIRLTSDCPLSDACLMDEMIAKFQTMNVDYLSNTINPTYPDGFDVEIFTIEALETSWKKAQLYSEREHVTPYMKKNYDQFKLFSYEYLKNYSDLRLTVDEIEDFNLIELLINQLGTEKNWLEYSHYLMNSSALKEINHKYKRNEGYELSLKKDGDRKSND